MRSARSAATATRRFVQPLRKASPVALQWMAEHAAATVFHRPAWSEAVEAGTGQRAWLVWAERDGMLVGALPLTLATSPVFGRALVSAGFAVNGGALAADGAALAALAVAVQELAARTRAAVELRGGPRPPGFIAAPATHVTFVRDLPDDRGPLLEAVPRKQRAEVRKAFGRNLLISHGTDECHRVAHHAVYAESLRNLGTPVFPRALFDAVLDRLPAEITLVRAPDGTPLSAVLSVRHHGTIIPYWGGGTRAARSERANEAMYFALMERALEHGCTRFDFGRSKIGSGPAAFKKNWGFEARPVVGWRWSPPGVSGRDVDSTSDANAWKTRLWQRLPLAVANRLGPPIARGLA